MPLTSTGCQDGLKCRLLHAVCNSPSSKPGILRALSMSSLFLLMIWCRPYDVARNGTSPSFSTLQVHSKVVLNLAPHHPGLQTAAGWADKAYSCRCMMCGCSLHV